MRWSFLRIFACDYPLSVADRTSTPRHRHPCVTQLVAIDIEVFTMSSSEPQLEAILAEYVVAEESGRTPSADEWIARFPKYQSELKEFLSLRRGFERFSSPLRDDFGSTLQMHRAGSIVGVDSKMSFPLTFGRYQLLGELGHGGMGVIYRARQDGLEREVALKMIHVGRFASESLRQRFRVEAIAVGRLNHSAIVPVYDVGEVEGQPYYTMKLLSGGDLVENVVRFKVDARAAAVAIVELAEGIQHAHEHGVLHRDLKPTNILFDASGKPYLSDFGLAKLLDDDGSLTRTGEYVGTPAYLAPELVCRAEDAAATSTDVYGLGAVFYFALTGEPPYCGSSPFSILEQIRTAEVPAVQKLRPEIPRDLATICSKCLDRNPRRRYASAKALADDFRHWLANEPIAARPVGRMERVRKWSVRQPAKAALVAVTAVAAVVLMIGATFHYESMRQSLSVSDELRSDGLAREARMRELLYVSDMRAAKRAFDRGDAKHLDELLQRQEPQSFMPEIRGWEWQLLSHARQSKPIAVWKGHDVGILWSAASPDGRLLATVDRRGSIKIWDIATHAQVAAWACGSQELTCVAFSPDGRILATCGQDRMLRLWSVGDWKPLAELSGHLRTITRLAFSPDGRTIATCGRDFRIVLWDVAGRKYRHSWIAHGDVVQAVAWSPDGKTLASCGTDALVKLWNSEDGTSRDTFDCPHKRTLLALAFRPDGGSILAAGYQPEIYTWDIATRDSHHFSAQTSTIFSMAFSDDGRLLTPGSKNHFVAWSLSDKGSDPKPLRCLDFSDTALRCVVPVPKSQEFFLVCDRGGIQHWDLSKLLLEDTLHVRDRVVAIANDGVRNVRTNNSGRLKFCENDKVIGEVSGHKGRVRFGLFSHDGTKFASGGDDETVKVWDVELCELVQSIDENISLRNGISLDRSGRKLAVCNRSGDVKIWTVGQSTPRQVAKGLGVVFCPDDRRLAIVADEPLGVTLLDCAVGKVIMQFASSQTVDFVAFTPDAATMICCGWEGSMAFWDTDSGKFQGQHHESTPGELADIAVSPDGGTVATIASNGPLRLWNVRTREELFILRAICRGSDGLRVCFTNDGSLLASEDAVGSGSAILRWHFGERVGLKDQVEIPMNATQRN